MTPGNGLQRLVPSFLTLRGRSLEVLELQSYSEYENMSEEIVTAIAQHCCELQRLQIGFESFSVPMTRIWKNLGKCLRHIELCQYTGPFPIANLMRIGDECNVFTHLSFYRFDFDGQLATIEFLCARYGALLQLLNLQSTTLSAPALNRIVSSCTALEIHKEIDIGVEPDFDRDSMLAMGKKAMKLTVPHGAFADDEDIVITLRRIGEQCTNLRKINLMEVPVPAFQPFFALPKPQLRILIIANAAEISAEVVFSVLVGKADRLEVFSYCGNFPPLEKLRRLVAATPRLRDVSFTVLPLCVCVIYSQYPHVQSKVLGLRLPHIVRAFLSNTGLETLYCNCRCPRSHEDFVEISKACLVARNRRLPVSVSGVCYF